MVCDIQYFLDIIHFCAIHNFKVDEWATFKIFFIRRDDQAYWSSLEECWHPHPIRGDVCGGNNSFPHSFYICCTVCTLMLQTTSQFVVSQEISSDLYQFGVGFFIPQDFHTIFCSAGTQLEPRHKCPFQLHKGQ